eukprot:1128634-Prorocentrum_minimum.AAC.1
MSIRDNTEFDVLIRCQVVVICWEKCEGVRIQGNLSVLGGLGEVAGCGGRWGAIVAGSMIQSMRSSGWRGL